MRDVVFTSRAYTKVMMHCAKYPHCAVNGVLLAVDDKNTEKPKIITYVDAIPLFHLCLHVTPMAEIALSQVEQWAESCGLTIAGYYLANENFNDVSYDRPAHKIADKIAEKFKSACLVVVDNKLVTMAHTSPAVRTLQNVDNKWKPLDKSKVTIEEETLEKTSVLFQNKVYYELADFDNHLDNIITSDWKNLRLNEQIDSILPTSDEKIGTS